MIAHYWQNHFQIIIYLQDLLFEGSSDSAIAIIRITGNLNLANAPLLEDQLADLLHKEYGETENEQPPTILLDLSCVPHIDPSGNQIYLGDVETYTVDTSFIFTKNKMLQNGFLIFLTLR